MLEIIRGILIGIFFIVSLALIILAMIQTKEDGGLSSAISGGAGNFYEKNKGNTKEGKLKRWTIILFAVFVILAITVSILYAM